MGEIIGIDLGTTNSVASYVENGKPRIINDSNNLGVIPSVVAKKNNEIIIGDIAKRNMIANPDETISEIKRKMGEKTTIILGEEEYFPQEISAMILKYIKKLAEDFLQTNVEEAVITVPAKFNDLQRRATKDAGEIAGLKVERIINEPTAAALAYGLDNFNNDEKVLVYDLGGGTFDVSVLELYDGIFDVIASDGDSNLGGMDFDRELSEYVISNLLKDYGNSFINDNKFKRKIIEYCEKAKIELSSLKTTNIIIPFATTFNDGDPLNIDMIITREEFNDLIYNYIKKTSKIIDKVLKDAKLGIKEIDVVLPVGGSTKIPYVKNMLSNKFVSQLKTRINPDKVVALGAAVSAGIKKDKFSDDINPIVTDICPYTLGLDIVSFDSGRLHQGVFDILIDKNTTIPINKNKIYTTLYDNQNEIKVSVYQGEDQLVKNNHFIGEFIIDNIPSAPAEEEEIEIEFNYNINGMLKVDATVLSNKYSKGEMFNHKSLSDEEIEKSKERLDKSWKKSSLASRVNTIIQSTERRLETLNESDRNHINNLLNKLKDALIKEEEELVNKYEDELTDSLIDIL